MVKKQDGGFFIITGNDNGDDHGRSFRFVAETVFAETLWVVLYPVYMDKITLHGGWVGGVILLMDIVYRENWRITTVLWSIFSQKARFPE
jgi:hypothetical protein